ncbi:MAG: IPT/TIG domain-containing protein [Planctomycetota bacterium]|nr:IPT/TIG domain-containing protein [Planctomycetota bacterium]
MGRRHPWRRTWRHSGLARLALTILAAGILFPGCGRKHGGKAAGSCNPTISRITPDTGDISGGEVVTIDAACFQDDFTQNPPRVFFGTDLAAVTPVDRDTVTVITPPHLTPEAVDVDVRSTGTVQFAYLPQGFTYINAPCTVLGVRPIQGSTVGGQTISIDGSDFDLSPLPVPTVEFGLGNPSSNVTVLSDALLEVVAPPGGPGVVDVIVTTQAGTCTRVGGFEYIAPGQCTVIAANPGQGFMDRTTRVTLVGTNFDLPPLPAPTVEFGLGNFGTVVSVLPGDFIEVDAPLSTTPGPVDVIVTNQGGQCVLPGGFEYLAPPSPPSCTITSLDPAFGPDFGATNITIYGSDFNVSTRVWIGAVEVTPVIFRSSTEIQVKSTPGTGTVAITVDIGGGTTCASNFDYISCGIQTCTLQRVVPNRANSGDLVTVSGAGFEQGAQIYFGDAPDLAQATVFDDTGLPTDLVVIVPPQAGPDPTVDVHVINPSGICCTRGNAFTYASCLIQSVLLDFGPPDGNVTVLITGTGFPVLGGPLPEVWFGTEQCTVVQRLSQTEVEVLTPPSAGQTAVEIRVNFPSGETCTYCCYTYYPGCVINVISPDSGGTNGGDLLTITGWGFEPGKTLLNPFPGDPCPTISPTIRFDDVRIPMGSFTLDPTGSEITVLSPPSFTGGPKDVVIKNWLFGTECSVTFTYVLPGASSCSITDIDPDNGYSCGQVAVDLWVTIRGDGFDANTGVLFGILPSTQVTFVSPQEIQVLVPTSREGLDPSGITIVDVVVAPEYSDPCILVGGFTYRFHACETMACAVAGASPSSGPVAGGNTITITGSGFCDPTYFPPPTPTGWIDILFGSEIVRATYVDDSTLSVVVPPSVTGPGPVDIIHIDARGCLAFCPGCYMYN